MAKTGSWWNLWNSKMIADKIDLLFNNEKSWKRIYENNLMFAGICHGKNILKGFTMHL